jgi:hypothetical protein
MKLISRVVLLAAMTWVLSDSSAHAWTKIQNNTGRPITVAYTLHSVSGFLCGYVTCNGNWRVRGWWNIPVGQSLVINGKPHHNGSHFFWAKATDGSNLEWNGGGGNWIGVFQPQAFDYCFVGPFIPSTAPAGSTVKSFFDFSFGECCGGLDCTGVNRTATLDP